MLDSFLQFHQSVQNGFGARRATWDVDIDRNDGVDALNSGVVVIEPARAGADAESDYPFGLAHLVVNGFQERRHFMLNGSDDKQTSSRAGEETRNPGTKSVDVVMRRSRGHVFHSTAGCDEGILEQGILPRPANGLFKLRGEESLRKHQESFGSWVSHETA